MATGGRDAEAAAAMEAVEAAVVEMVAWRYREIRRDIEGFNELRGLDELGRLGGDGGEIQGDTASYDGVCMRARLDELGRREECRLVLVWIVRLVELKEEHGTEEGGITRGKGGESVSDGETEPSGGERWQRRYSG